MKDLIGYGKPNGNAPEPESNHRILFPKLQKNECKSHFQRPKESHSSTASSQNIDRKLPILLFDIMDTIVRDPFYHDVPPFFGMSFEELIEIKHPTAWIEFEKGMIDEWGTRDDDQLLSSGYCNSDDNAGDHDGGWLKNCMRRGYSYIDGVAELLYDLKQNNYEMHAFTNYPWYDEIDLSYYRLRAEMAHHPLQIVIYRLTNVKAAIEVGIVGLHFKSANMLREDLSRIGINISADEHHKN
ncbi:hypothetical protein GH714_004378 [Hevea brasiliensis]|uniref:Uncharacterized protein n=1 Tax=Hevea brasiliensis TaxID=3981 RepID=A0A6A6M7F6_HEVBR|nr:hypothetical protein GH714_004378 [Hevea brasiliensis]